MIEKEYKDAKSAMWACCSVTAVFAALLIVDLVTGTHSGVGFYIHAAGTVIWALVSVTQIMRFRAAAEKMKKIKNGRDK